MDSAQVTAESQQQAWSDEQVIDAVLSGNPALYELLVRRYNQRLYRAVRSIVHDDSEAEDVMQEAYVRAYQHLRDFERRASFSTWLTRIAVHEALARVEKSKRLETVDFSDEEEMNMPLSSLLNPEEATSSRETRELLEHAILSLPLHYRTVLMLRDVEEMSIAETAAAMQLTEETIKVRLHRARALLRKSLYIRAGATSSMAFQFLAPRCDRVTKHVMERILRV